MTRSLASSETTKVRLLDSVRARFGVLVLSHPVVDAYAGFVPPLLGLLQVRCNLTPWETASLLSIGPLTSGLCQPFFAWFTDRVDSRIPAALGLAIGAASLSCIGLAQSFPTLVLLFAIGMLGVGAYHPIAAATGGQLAGRRRSAGVTAFFVAGMVGATAGPIISSAVVTASPQGFDHLRWFMIPGVLFAMLLYVAIRDVPHRHHDEKSITFEPAELSQRWRTVLLLFVGNALRYSVNIALFYVYVRWAEVVVAGEDAALTGSELKNVAARFCGRLNALTMFGMGVGGLLAGMTIRHGRERWPIIVLPLLFAPAIALFSLTGRVGSYGLAVIAGIGYAAIIPITISLAQRLLPHRTSLASSLTMGGAWAVGALAPPAVEWCLGAHGFATTFAAIACLLAASGVVGLLLPAQVVREA